MNASTHQYRLVCPVMGTLGYEPIETREDAEEWAIARAYDHRHHSCRGQGHTIESRYVGPWGPVDRPVRSLTVMEGP